MIALKGIDDYIKDLARPDVRVRRHAAFQLQYFGPGAAAPLRASIREDPDHMVRLGAINSLGWLGDDGCIGDLLTILLEGDEFTAQEAATVLGELGSESAREPLLSAARDPGQPNREAILRALGAYPGGGVEEELMRIMGETDYIDEAIACAESLAELQYYRAAPEIVQLYHQSDDEIVKDDFLACLAALLGEPRLAMNISFDVNTFINSVDTGLIAGDGKKKSAVLKALKKKDCRRLSKLIKEPIIRTTKSVFINAGVWNESALNLSEEEFLDKIKDTRLGSCIAIIDYFEKADIPARNSHFRTNKKDIWLVACSVYPILRELDKVMLKSEGKLDPVVDLVNELTRRYTVSPRRLIKEVAGYGNQAVRTLAEYLHSASVVDDGMYEGWCIAEALGHIGTPDAVEGLLESFSNMSEEDEEEGSVCSVQEALARCGETAVGQIINYVKSWDKDEEDINEEDIEEENNDDWDEPADEDEEGSNDIWPGVFACGALAKIRHQKVFDFLLSRLAHPDEDVRRTTLEQLLEYGDPEAIFQVRRMLDDESDDVVYAAKVALVGLCDANGVNLADLDKLRAELEEDDLDFPGEYIDDPEDEDWFWDDDFNNDNKFVPIVKPPKIGRNELCPCGSGKKYKKCCGKDIN
ncbi:HEAT repeat domain-containing protein [Pelotomaculum isophthalicicum JI]|uniref:HEAT repeat domain-containing protein n=1 Tax=Pelotomaculum isophthalicicum JI TaxID=947010 RepID=A0A9X4H685_9FIRM|nr:HEAT repeat domain-containing protein [Pelotomaculum isophthalicicum]MDF9408708.1 HEAT repeat domain-containing protein [Pelotomaculum isophthalicicum JI]